MAGEVVSFGIQKLSELLSHEYEQFQGVKDQVTTLTSDLNLLKSFLKDAYAKKHTSDVVKTCIEEIKEIVFDAEDIIETLIRKDELGKHGGITKRIRRLSCIIPERRKIAKEIGGISKRILKVVRDMKDFGVQQVIADGRDPQPLQGRLEFARMYESNLVGLEVNVKKLVGHLVEEDDVQVVSMTGMGGLGKTTLARQAFHHYKVKKKFDRLVWVCVTQDCNPINVWQTILRTLRPNEEQKISETTDATVLQDELFRLFETSKSLVIFDDIWKEEDWNLIKPIFPHRKGSKVLLTSRNERVAGHEETYINFQPECLSDQDSWTLFERIAMPSKDASEMKNVKKEMEEMGKQMIKQCRGLPLAVRVLGGLLAVNYTVHYWKRVSENIGSHLRDDNSFNHVLSLSYEELPGYLKYCFLYLAHFPEDYEINVEDLSYYWAAERIVWNNDGGTIGDVGDSYMEELVRRNMVISERDKNTSRFETCRLHDMMREICLSKAKEENFLQIVGIRSPTTQSLSTSRRFVSQYPDTLDVERELNNSKVRSLMLVKDNEDIYWRSLYWNISSISFTSLQLLRVLHLPKAGFKGGKLSNSIGKLIHLRYLNLKGALVSHLPSSLQNLNCLIYLNLDVQWHSSIVTWVMGSKLPNVLMGMKELRYLALPRRMHKKTKLGLSNLVNLETLKNFSTKNNSLEDLCGMARLRTLGIRITGGSSLENLSASISGLRHLENLDIVYSGAKGTKEWGTQLDLINLKQLTLNINIPLLSDELQFPSHLTSLILKKSNLEEDPMPILEKLLHLKEVKLWRESFSGRRMVCSRGGFPQLQTLELLGLMELEEWIVEEGSMPLLHTLRIRGCKKLKEVPDGLRFITSLKNLIVYGMREDYKERLSEGGEDYYKVQHIPSVKIYF